jgi:catechol 2,3-dioxygenase-like lactoylglutathione lyase family enzyme
MIGQLGTVGVPTTDQDKALEFYVEKLGFEKRRDLPFGPGMRWIEVAPVGSETSIALAPAREGQPVGVDTGIRLSTNDAAGDHADMLAKGIDVDEEIMLMGNGVPPMFTFRDPDGNRLYVVESA